MQQVIHSMAVRLGWSLTTNSNNDVRMQRSGTAFAASFYFKNYRGQISYVGQTFI